MKDRVGQVWQLTMVNGDPIVLILETNPVTRMHRCLVLDSFEREWPAGRVLTLSNWDDTNYGWERLS